MLQPASSTAFTSSSSQQQPSAASTAPSVPTPHQNLLDFYRSRIDEFDKEREDLLLRLKELDESVEERHAQRQAQNRMEAEIFTLRQQLRDARSVLQDAVERNIDLSAENDALKVQEMDDRRKIQQLLQLCNPDNEEICLQRNAAATRIKHPSNKIAAPQIKTIFMPDDGEDSLTFRVESLNLELKEKERLWAVTEEVLREELRVSSEQFILYRNRSNAEIESLQQRLHKAEQDFKDTTKDYLYLRHFSQQREREWKEEMDKLNNQNILLLKRLDDAIVDGKQGVQDAAKFVENQNNLVMEQCRVRAQAAEDVVYNLKTEFLEMKQALQKKIDKEKEKSKILKEKLKNSELAREHQYSGLLQDVAGIQQNLRKLLNQLQKEARDRIKEEAEGCHYLVPRPSTARVRNKGENNNNKHNNKPHDVIYILDMMTAVKDMTTSITEISHTLKQKQQQQE